jgi:hypothetical protein
MPLVELAKNPIYKKQIAKIINFSDVECHPDMINLKNERPTIMLVRTSKIIRIMLLHFILH